MENRIGNMLGFLMCEVSQILSNKVKYTQIMDTLYLDVLKVRAELIVD